MPALPVTLMGLVRLPEVEGHAPTGLFPVMFREVILSIDFRLGRRAWRNVDFIGYFNARDRSAEYGGLMLGLLILRWRFNFVGTFRAVDCDVAFATAFEAFPLRVGNETFTPVVGPPLL